jgi:hypothetical protein
MARTTFITAKQPNLLVLSWFPKPAKFLYREPLLKGKAQNSFPPATNKLRSADFDHANIIYFFYKASYLNEKVNRAVLCSLFSI